MTKEELEKEAEEKYCKGCKLRMEQCLWAWRSTNGKNELKNCSCKVVPSYLAGAEPREKRIAELEEKISVLLSCKNCPENKGGYICEKEYENKCLAQKMQFIKELQQENAELKNQVSYLKDNLRVARKDRENLQLDVAKGLKEFVKDYPATSLRYIANEKYVVQLTKAKELIRTLLLVADNKVSQMEFQLCIADAKGFLKDSEVEK